MLQQDEWLLLKKELRQLKKEKQNPCVYRGNQQFIDQHIQFIECVISRYDHYDQH